MGGLGGKYEQRSRAREDNRLPVGNVVLRSASRIRSYAVLEPAEGVSIEAIMVVGLLVALIVVIIVTRRN